MANLTAPALPWGITEPTLPSAIDDSLTAEEAENLEPMTLEELGLAAGSRIEVTLQLDATGLIGLTRALSLKGITMFRSSGKSTRAKRKSNLAAG